MNWSAPFAGNDQIIDNNENCQNMENIHNNHYHSVQFELKTAANILSTIMLMKMIKFN